MLYVIISNVLYVVNITYNVLYNQDLYNAVRISTVTGAPRKPYFLLIISNYGIIYNEIRGQVNINL